MPLSDARVQVDLPTVVSVAAGEDRRIGRLPVEPYAFCRLTFAARAASPGYWATHALDGDGQELVDNHSSVYAADDWLPHETCFRGVPGAVSCELGFRAREGDMEIRDIAVAPVEAAQVRCWADALYASLPPLAYTPPPGRHRLIPRTIARLRAGATVRLVLLGDSISNDVCNTWFDALVEPGYPGCDLQVVASAVGSKGPAYFLDDAHFDRFVASREPDLVMVCAVSNGDGTDPIEALVRRLRALPGCEPVLVSAPFGEDHRFAPDDSFPRAREIIDKMLERRAFASVQAALCARLGVEYLDLRNPWTDYLETSGRPRTWFHRDNSHANDRGKQIVARMLARWFAPTL